MTTTKPGMLVLSRRVGGRIVITVPPAAEATEIIVEVTDLRVQTDRPTVRLGVIAPRAVSVDREEIHEAKQREAAADVVRELQSLDEGEGEGCERCGKFGVFSLYTMYNGTAHGCPSYEIRQFCAECRRALEKTRTFVNTVDPAGGAA